MTKDLDALPLPSFVKTSPERIYLVIGDNLEDGDKFSDLDEVTWCQDKQYDTDIEYVRADVVREIVAAEHLYSPPPKGDEASEVLALLDSGEWELTRHPDTDSMLTDEWCAKNRWSVRRTTAPFCGRDGVRCWSAPTPLEAFAKARAALAAQQSKGEAS